MFLSALTLIHVLTGAGAIGLGLIFVTRLASRHIDARQAIRFLKWSLAAGATGLLFSPRHPSAIGWAAMLGVYLSAFAAFAWRRYRATNRWLPGFVFSALGVFCLDTAILYVHIAKFLLRLNVFTPAGFSSVFLVSSAIGGLLFALLSIFVTMRFRYKVNRPTV